MKNYQASGDQLTLTAPSGGVVSGSAYKIGSLVVVAAGSAAENDPFVGLPSGVFTVVKATGATWSVGEKIYWDDTAKKFTTTATSNTLVGVATAAAASGDTTGSARLDGAVR